jgi:hypothetical protein
MKECAEEIITEMEEDHLNPVAALLEQMISRRAASKLLRHHQEPLIREVLQIGLKQAKELWEVAATLEGKEPYNTSGT